MMNYLQIHKLKQKTPFSDSESYLSFNMITLTYFNPRGQFVKILMI